MSDLHTGLTHDLPMTRAKVYKQGQWWTWHHFCAWKQHETNGYPHDTMPNALVHALKHMENCW